MSLTLTQRDVLLSLLPSPDSVELFTIDNRHVLDALNALVEDFRQRKQSSGQHTPVSNVRLQGGLDQVVVLQELARESGLVTIQTGRTLVVQVPNDADYRIDVELIALAEVQAGVDKGRLQAGLSGC